MKVPKNKKVYVGTRRFVEGDILPSYIMHRHDINLESEEDKIINSYEKRGRGRPKKSGQETFNY